MKLTMSNAEITRLGHTGGVIAGVVAAAGAGYRYTKRAQPRLPRVPVTAVSLAAAIVVRTVTARKQAGQHAKPLPRHADPYVGQVPLRYVPERNPVTPEVVWVDGKPYVQVGSEYVTGASRDEQRELYAAALRDDKSHVLANSLIAAGGACTMLALKRGLIGDRKRLSGRRAATLALAQLAHAGVLTFTSRAVNQRLRDAALANA